MTEKHVYLNGALVPPSDISPKVHRFVGMFRPPVDPVKGARSDVLCDCGDFLRYVHQGPEHYARGCWDVPQYVDIGKDQPKTT